MNDRRHTATVLVATFALTLWGGSMALAHHKPDHAGGPPTEASGGGQSEHPTEDTDSDGVPNTPDPVGDADNQHPSGKDKHAEAGGSGNQGWATSEPDQNASGPERDVDGRDQPGNTGGADKLDQDGNNGCGNDDDFEDDNEGNCGGKKGDQPPPTVTEPPPTTTTEEPPEDGVLGESGDDQVKGAVAAAAPSQPVVASEGELAFTGPVVDVVPLVALAVWLLAAGVTLLVSGRERATR